LKNKSTYLQLIRTPHTQAQTIIIYSEDLIHVFKGYYCVFRSLLDISAIHIPDQDRKILDSMRRKREEKQYGEDLAHRVNVFWEQMREEEKRLTKEQKQKWQDFITAKRNVENGVKHLRLDELRVAFENNQRQLEEHMIQKDIKVNELKQTIGDRKVGIINEQYS